MDATRGVSFLVAEDDVAVGRLLARALAAHGDAALVATCSDAQELLSRKSFAGVVADVGLPDGSGLELVAAARRRSPRTVALVVSGHVDANRLRAAHAIGAHFLLKPLDAHELALFVERVRARAGHRDAAILARVEAWTGAYELTGAEAKILELAAFGASSRRQLATLRGVEPSTIKKQVQVLLDKAGAPTLEAAVSRLLREALRRG